MDGHFLAAADDRRRAAPGASRVGAVGEACVLGIRDRGALSACWLWCGEGLGWCRGAVLVSVLRARRG